MTTWLPAWTTEEGARRVTDGFRATYDAEPDGVWAAPGRANLIGEHVDYTGGLCMPFAIPHRTYVAMRRRDDDAVRLASAQESAPWEGRISEVDGVLAGWAGYAVGVAWALDQAGYPVSGFDAYVDSCVPYGAGLSSSAALECAVAVGVDDLNGLNLGGSDDGRKILVEACVRAENEVAGANTGGLDQAASLRSVAEHVLLLDCNDGSIRPIPFALGDHALLVIDTRAPHQLADGQYAQRRAATAAAAADLGYPNLRPATVADLERLPDDLVPFARHVVTEIARVQHVEALLAAGDVEAVGPVLTAGHASLRDDYRVTVGELDVCVDAAIAGGALGARMVGGGFGGSVIALIRESEADVVAAAVEDAFAAHGFNRPAFLVATAAEPAGRVKVS